jgi:ABC-type multidrug transport system permease subunit
MAEYLLRQAVPVPLQRETLSGRAIRYGDWLLPGVIGMNLMFSGLFGVGFVIVRYRKNGVLKRLRATPLGALEFLFAQLLSRVLITLVVSLLVFCAAYWLLDVPLLGSGWLLLVIALREERPWPPLACWSRPACRTRSWRAVCSTSSACP